MTRQPRVLILHASGGMGHVKAAAAIAAAFARGYPAITVADVNTLEFSRPGFRFFYEDGYNFVSAHWVQLWGWLYRRFNRAERHGLPLRLSLWGVTRDLLPFIDKFRPDVIIGTHPLPTRVLANCGRTDIAAIPTAIVVTDYGCHSFWVDRKTSCFFVATDEVKACVTGYGVPPERVVVSGIPIDPKFSRPLPRRELQAKFGLDPRQPTVLVVGGLVAVAYLESFVAELRQRQPVQFLVVAGRDQRLQRQLRSSSLAHHPHVRLFDFVDNLEELLAVADVAVTKGGGLTVTECLAMGVPVAIPGVIPGQEEDNLNFLVRHGVGVHAKTAAAMVSALAQMLADRAGLERMQRRCRELSRPNAAAVIAETVVRNYSPASNTFIPPAALPGAG